MLHPFHKKRRPRTVGIRLSGDNLSLVVLDCQNIDNPKIADYLNYTINQKTPVEKMRASIKQYVENNNLQDTHCCVVLDDRDYQLLVVEPPDVAKHEMAEAMKWKIKDLIPFAVTDTVVDVFLQPETRSFSKNIADVVVVHKDVIQARVDLVSEIGLQLSAIDIPEFSYRNYFEKTKYSQKSIALVLVKKSRGKLIVLYQSNVYFSRSFQISYNGGVQDDIPESEIVLEVQRSLDYYERQLKQVMPSIVVMVGDNVTEKKISNITRDSFHQDVVVGSVNHLKIPEDENLETARVIETYGASLRKGLLTKVA